MATTTTLSVYDYVVIAATLAVPLGIGAYLAIWGERTTPKRNICLEGEVFIRSLSCCRFCDVHVGNVANRNTGRDVHNWVGFFLFVVSTSVSYPIALITVVPVMHALQVTSMYEYFQLRFGSPTLRLLVTLVGMLQKILFTAVMLLSPSLSIQTATGLPFWVSVVIVGLVGIIYTSIGGIRGVVVADVFQTAIIIVGVIAILVKCIGDTGGLEKSLELAKEGGRITPGNFDFDPRERHSFWALAIGGTFTFCAYSFDQSAIQRICALPTITRARIAYIGNMLLVAVYITCVCFMGVLAYSYFAATGCDPFKAGILTNRNQLMPFVVLELFKDLPGMPGLYLATIFSAALSTLSSVTNGLAANTVEDILKWPFERCKTKESVKLFVAKVAVWFYGGLCIGLAFLARTLPGTLIQLTLGFLGACGGPVLGVFSLGALIPWTNKIGALSGLVASLVVNMWLSIGAALYGLKPIPLPPAPGNSCDVLYPTNVNDLNISTTSPTVLNVASTTVSSSNVIPEDGHPFYDISYQYYGFTGWLAAFVVGLLISLVTYRMYPPITDERLLIPIARLIWNFVRNQDSHEEGKEKPATQQYPSHTSSMPPKPESQPDRKDGHVWSIRL
ncbi:sodium-coupled monocarboxylate transporter 2-like isoform X1 [Haliotis rubra]|uniref:sodium-coupled monocarboxylate transporter 2-like isoform X1 n=1 Tax=Haliotis rubra TaxID=36100 RepID=UPI001EE524A8|nr:sodium-coupled monocarboxylate transporter 2-like isoform X1 [Haliotis rubra]